MKKKVTLCDKCIGKVAINKCLLCDKDLCKNCTRTWGYLTCTKSKKEPIHTCIHCHALLNTIFGTEPETLSKLFEKAKLRELLRSELKLKYQKQKQKEQELEGKQKLEGGNEQNQNEK